MPFQQKEDCSLLTLNQVLKHLKREESGLYNCIHSISADTTFVRSIAAQYRQLPLCANLRCGLWYTPDPDLTCYFKSTDGHYGNWNFSLTRLNLHVALAAASGGGCIIVDATRRGKTFSVRLSMRRRYTSVRCGLWRCWKNLRFACRTL